MKADVVIIGAGAAGLFTALSLMPKKAIVLSEKPLGDGCASAWSQGGLAAAVGEGDTPQRHAADTLKAADGTAETPVVRTLTAEAPEAVKLLEKLGVRFERGEGGFRLSREACHSERRVLKAAAGDGFGRELMRALAEAVRNAPSITFMEGFSAERLVQNGGRVQGVVARNLKDGGTLVLSAPAVVLATGGLGGLYAHTTNPLGAVGRGIALAARAGAVLSDLEFVQFHPTALDLGPALARDAELSPMPLATEALRGEGAWLLNSRGERFVDELAPRDAVSRAIFAQMQKGQRVYLDCRALDTRRFPALRAACGRAGADPQHSLVPVAPAAHYHMGGVATDLCGRTSLSGLWACGEVAATGLHGANRLASNSLMEAVVMARRVAADIFAARPAGVAPLKAEALPVQRDNPAAREALRHTMTEFFGVIRDGRGMAAGLEEMTRIAERAKNDFILADMALVARLVAMAALRRTESRGGHWRADFPHAAKAWQRRSFSTLAEALPVPQRESAA
jgi:L-aspartate oxidase